MQAFRAEEPYVAQGPTIASFEGSELTSTELPGTPGGRTLTSRSALTAGTLYGPRCYLELLAEFSRVIGGEAEAYLN